MNGNVLNPVAPDAAARVVQQLARAPDRLADYPRIGEKLEAYEPREVRRIIVGNYEMRYEIALRNDLCSSPLARPRKP